MYNKSAEMRLTLLEAKETDLDWGTQTQSIDLCTYSKMLTVIFIWCYCCCRLQTICAFYLNYFPWFSPTATKSQLCLSSVQRGDE